MNAINPSSPSNSPSRVENSNRLSDDNPIIRSNSPRQQFSSSRRYAYIAGLTRQNKINHALAVNLSSLSDLALLSPISRSEVQRGFTGREFQNLSAQSLRSLRSAENISRLPTIWESPKEG